MKRRAAAQRLVSAAVAAACSSKQLSPKTSNTERDHAPNRDHPPPPPYTPLVFTEFNRYSVICSSSTCCKVEKSSRAVHVYVHKAISPSGVTGAVLAQHCLTVLRSYLKIPKHPVTCIFKSDTSDMSSSDDDAWVDVQQNAPLEIPEWSCQDTFREGRRFSDMTYAELYEKIQALHVKKLFEALSKLKP